MGGSGVSRSDQLHFFEGSSVSGVPVMVLTNYGYSAGMLEEQYSEASAHYPRADTRVQEVVDKVVSLSKGSS